VYGNGLTQYACGTDSVVALANVAMLTGNVTGTGCGIYALQRENNGQGACDAGSLPDFLPGYQDIDDTGIRQLFEEQWKCKIPVQKGLTAIEMIASVGKGQIKAMYIVGENPVLSFPQTAGHFYNRNSRAGYCSPSGSMLRRKRRHRNKF
jgi:predicted molibdopterin-dependent oxidoreductase YjgC